jgi:hypothetical protein
MQTKQIVRIVMLLLMVGCDREPAIDPYITFAGASACKSAGLKSATDHPSDQDCLQFKWVEGDSLILKHVNASFNCCPKGFRTEVKVAGDTIIISEYENESICDCNCLFDLDYYVVGITKGTWWIRVEEPYIQQQEQEKIMFKAEFKKFPESEFCVTRTGYPWGT